MSKEPLNKLCAAALRPEFSIAALQNLAIVRAIPGVLRLALKNSASQISSPKLVQRLLKQNIPLRFTLLICLTMQSSILLAKNTQDPMRPPHFNPSSPAVTAVAQPWNLTEILISGDRRVAIINDKLVKAGDTINSAKIISINTGYVVLTANNKTFKHYMSRISVKQQTLPGTE